MMVVSDKLKIKVLAFVSIACDANVTSPALVTRSWGNILGYPMSQKGELEGGRKWL